MNLTLIEELRNELIASACWYRSMVHNGRYDMIEPARQELLKAVDNYEAEIADGD